MSTRDCNKNTSRQAPFVLRSAIDKLDQAGRSVDPSPEGGSPNSSQPGTRAVPPARFGSPPGPDGPGWVAWVTESRLKNKRSLNCLLGVPRPARRPSACECERAGGLGAAIHARAATRASRCLPSQGGPRPALVGSPGSETVPCCEKRRKATGGASVSKGGGSPPRDVRASRPFLVIPDQRTELD